MPFYPPKQKERFLPFLRFVATQTGPPSTRDQKTTEQDIANTLRSFSKSDWVQIRSLIPLIYHKVKQTELSQTLPPVILEQLKKYMLLQLGRDMLYRYGLAGIFTLFKEANVPVILLKGAAFAGTLYSVKTPRPGVDLDLLVREADFDKAGILMEQIMEPVLLDDARVATHQTLFERVFIPKKGLGPTVEIHRGLTNPSIFTIAEEPLWQASRKHPIHNSKLVRILSPEDTLLHLAVHAFRDLDFCTHNIIDAHEVWCQWHPDPEKLLQRAGQWGAKKVLYYLLVNCKTIVGSLVNDEFLDKLTPGTIVGKINTTLLSQEQAEGRLLQLISQLTFPDYLSCGLKFQIGYARTRFADWLIARKSRHNDSK